MKKSQIISFIRRYYLGGKTESAQWDTFDNKLETPFITNEKSCMGNVRLKNFNGFEPNQTIGILNTTPLLSQIGSIREDVDLDTSLIKLEKECEDSRIAAIEFTLRRDEMREPLISKFMCADLKVVSRNTGLKRTPEWDLVFTLDTRDSIDEFIDEFISSQKGLDTKEFHIMKKSGKYKFILGNLNARNVTLTEIPVDVKDNIDAVKFPAIEMREILNANKTATKLIFNVSGHGLSWMHIEDGDFECDYYLVSED